MIKLKAAKAFLLITAGGNSTPLSNLIASCPEILTCRTKKNKNYLHLAAELDKAQFMKVILDSADQTDVSRTKKDNLVNAQLKLTLNTPLHLACKNKSLQCISLLLQHGAYYNIENSDYKIPVHLCSYKEGIKLLQDVDKFCKYASLRYYKNEYFKVIPDWIRELEKMTIKMQYENYLSIVMAKDIKTQNSVGKITNYWKVEIQDLTHYVLEAKAINDAQKEENIEQNSLYRAQRLYMDGYKLEAVEVLKQCKTPESLLKQGEIHYQLSRQSTTIAQKLAYLNDAKDLFVTSQTLLRTNTKYYPLECEINQHIKRTEEELELTKNSIDNNTLPSPVVQEHQTQQNISHPKYPLQDSQQPSSLHDSLNYLLMQNRELHKTLSEKLERLHDKVEDIHQTQLMQQHFVPPAPPQPNHQDDVNDVLHRHTENQNEFGFTPSQSSGSNVSRPVLLLQKKFSFAALRTFFQKRAQTSSVENSQGSIKSSVRSTGCRYNSDVTEVEHDPTAPIIPLTDAVPLATVEKNEKEIYRARAELFRIVEKKWKERGTGIIKLLKNANGQIHLLMHHEQDFTICANHTLRKNSELIPMFQNNKAYIWISNDYASDYADEKVGLEKFCIRFQSVEEAGRFEKSFGKAKDSLFEKNASLINIESSHETLKSFAPTSWTCSNCNLSNNPLVQYCVKDPSMPAKSKATGGLLIDTGLAANTKSTTTFGMPVSQITPIKESTGFNVNFSSKPSEKAVSIFGSNKTATLNTSGISGFLFDSQPSTTPSSSGGGEFKFGSSGKSFDLQFQTKSPPVELPECSETSDDKQAEESDDECFAPVIPLPDKVEMKADEEGEEVLYCQRAKLFRFDPTAKEWKERGLGDIKMLRHTDTKKLRLVMRRERVLKICLNHAVTDTLDITSKDDKTWMWDAGDYSRGEIEYLQFACRFKTPEMAKEFKEAVDNALKGGDDVMPVSGSKSIAKNSSSCDIEALYKVTEEEEENGEVESIIPLPDAIKVLTGEEDDEKS